MSRKAPTRLTSETFTATGAGTTINYANNPVQSFAIGIKGTGAAATSWTVAVQVSLDDVNWTTIIEHTTATGDGTIKFSGANLFPAPYVRLNCTALSLGGATNIIAQLVCLGPQK